MRGVLFWLVELVCRPVDAMVCEIANLTDEPELSAFERSASPYRISA